MLLDFIRYLLHYLPEVLILSPIVYFAYRELRTETRWRRVMGVMAAVGGVAAILFLATGWPQAPHHNWSNGRLAPAISWVKGYSLYAYPDQGPMLVQMYGPVSAMVYLPTALMSRPTTAVLLGAFINSLLYILPAGWFLYRSGRGQGWIFIVAAFVAFILLSSRQFMLLEAAAVVTIDAPAVGFAACALAILAGARVDQMGRVGVICGIFAALSIWTKLTFAPIVLAMFAYASMIASPRGAMRFVIGMATAGLVITGVLLLCFGMPLIFQNVIVPSHQPWQWPRLSAAEAYWKAIRWIWRDARPMGWLSIVGILLAIRFPSFRADSFRKWARENPWLLPLMSAIAVLPTAALAYVKFGGSWNNAVASCYMILLAMVAALSGACRAEESDAAIPARSRRARVSLAMLLLLGCWIGPETLPGLRAGLAAWGRVNANANEIAYQHAKRHSGETYFSSYPLATLLAEGRLYHFDAAIDSLHIAGYPVTDESFRAHLPPKMQSIMYRIDNPRPALLDRLPEFDKQVEVAEMPGWVVITRSERVQ